MRKNRKAAIVRDERGNVAVLVALLMLPMTLGIGVAVDFGRGNRAEADMQSALDGAAIAALRSTPEAAEDVGTRFFTANFKNHLITTPVVNFDVKEDGKVAATARGSLEMPFGGLIGIDTFEIAATTTVVPERDVATTETSEVVVTGGAPCLHVMDQSDQESLLISDSTNVDATTCDVRVRSNRSTALRGKGNSGVKFRSVKVKGQYSTEGGIAVSGWPYDITADADIVGNPYLDGIRDVVQALSVGSCTNANTGKTYTGTASPGTYCGTTTFDGVTLQPGVYVIKSSSGNKNGELVIKGLVSGNGVTFYLADNKSSLKEYNATAGSSLTAPTTGTTRGILFFENSNRGAAWDLSISDETNQTWQGLVYLPSANIVMDKFTSWQKFNVSLAANTVTMSNWNNMKWESFVWYPYNKTSPILYDNETYMSETTTITEKPLYIAQ